MDKFEDVLVYYTKKFNAEIVKKGVVTTYCEQIPFTSPMMNYITHGGFPRGRIVEFYGTESSGKTTTAIDVCVNAQRIFKEEFEARKKEPSKAKRKKNAVEEDEEKPLRIMYFDLEQTFDPKWALSLGLDVNEIYFVRPEGQTAEDLLDMIINFLASGGVGLIVMDSVPALVPQVEMQNDLDQQTRGGVAKLLGTFLRKVIPHLNRSSASLLIINQLRDSMSQYEAYKTPGGRALKFYAALRLYFQKGDLLNEELEEIKRSSEKAYGNVVQVRVEKTKVFRPDRLLGYYTLTYFEGINKERDLVYLLTSNHMIHKSGSWFHFTDIQGTVFEYEDGKIIKVQGEKNIANMIKEVEVLRNYYNSILPDLIK